MIDSSKINKILLITLSNLGDAILSSSVLYVLKREFPQATVDLVCGEASSKAFEEDPAVRNKYIYRKRTTLKSKIDFVCTLRKERYDLVIDLKNSFMGFLLGARYKSSVLRGKTSGTHMQDVHLGKLKALGINIKRARRRIYVAEEAARRAKGLLEDTNSGKVKVIINPSAKSDLKKWPLENYVRLSSKIAGAYPANIISVGSQTEKASIDRLACEAGVHIKNLCGQTSIGELTAILEQADILITNDTATLHIAGAVDSLKVIALFGPTDPVKYGPIGRKDRVVRLDLDCSPCEKAQCPLGTHKCMRDLSVDEVYDAFKAAAQE